MEIDEYIQQKKAVEAKHTLNAAKKRLREEKDKLHETRKKAKLRDRDDEPVYIPPKDNSGIVIKPWMIWNIIFFLIIIALLVFLFTKDTSKVSETDMQRLIDEAKEEAKQEQAELAKSKELEEKLAELEKKLDGEEEPELIKAPLLPPKFTLNAVDDASEEDIGNKGEITVLNNATEAKYEIVIKNEEREILRCDADKTVEGKTKDNFFENLKIDPYEREKIPQEVTGTGRVDIEFDVRCKYENSDEISREKIQFFYYFG